MNENFPSSQHLNPLPIHQQNAFVNLTFSDVRYRLRTREYFYLIGVLKLWASIWISFSIVNVGIIIDALTLNNGMIFCISMAFSFWGLVDFAFKNKRTVGRGLWITFIVFGTFMIINLFLLCLKEKSFLLAATLLVISECINGTINGVSRITVIIEVVIILEIFFIAFKLDHDGFFSWGEAFFFFTVLWFVSIIIIITLGIFFILSVFYFQQPFFHFKHYGITCVMLNFLCLLFLTSIPLSLAHSLIVFEVEWVCVISIIMNVICCWFQLASMEKIILFFSNLQEVKGYNQIINLIRLQDQQLIKKFIKRGQNWYQGSTDGSEELSDKEKCLVCLENDCMMMWMPCGHLTVCQGCASRLINYKNINCVLCKKTPKQIYQVAFTEGEVITVGAYKVEIV